MAGTARLSASTQPRFGANLALGVGGLLSVFLAALIAGWFSHTAGAIVAIIGGLGLAAWWLPQIPREAWRDPAVLGVVVVALSPLVPARLSAGVAGLSPDDIPLVLGTLLLGWSVVRSGHWRGVFHWVAAPLWAFAVWNGVAVVASVDNSAAAFARGPGRWALVALAFSLMINVLERRPELVTVMVSSILLVGCAEALFGLWAYLVDWTIRSDVRAVLIGLELWRWYQPLVESTPGRISGTLGVSSNFFGALMLIPAMLSLSWMSVARERQERTASSIVFAAVFFGLVLSYTRASLIGAVGAGLLLLLVLRSRNASLLAVVVLGAALVFTPTVSRFLDEGNDRLALTERALQEIAENPEFGLGAGSQTGGTIDPDLQVLVATPHNSFLLAAAETGALGGLLLLAAALLPGAIGAWAVMRGRGDAMLAGLTAGLLAFGVQTFSNNLFHIPTVAAWYWLAAAGVVVLARSVPDHGDPLPILGQEDRHGDEDGPVPHE